MLLDYGRNSCSTRRIFNINYHFCALLKSDGQTLINAMAGREKQGTSSTAAMRWRILRRSLLSEADVEFENEIKKVSRVPAGSFGLIACRRLDPGDDDSVEYILPGTDVRLFLRQARNDQFKLSDYSNCRKLGIDNTGIVGLWPAEEILAHYCLSHPAIFRNKRIVELGAGYGLAGLALAACTEAAEVVITDGNPKVVDYIEENIRTNSPVFGETRVSSSVLYWSKEQAKLPGSAFDMIIAADCTYFKDFHVELACTIKCVLETAENSQAMLFCPARGNSLKEFLQIVQGVGLDVVVVEQYDANIWKLHKTFLEKGNTAWPNYDEDHNYPLFVSITLKQGI